MFKINKLTRPLALGLLLFLSGCATPSLSDLQIRSIESKEFEGSYDNAFKATMQVLQDKGFIIEHTDFSAGMIKASTGMKSGFWGVDSKISASVSIEAFGENSVKERIVFLEESRANMGQYGTREDSKRIEDPKYLQQIYDAIQKEIFVRKNLAH